MDFVKLNPNWWIIGRDKISLFRLTSHWVNYTFRETTLILCTPSWGQVQLKKQNNSFVTMRDAQTDVLTTFDYIFSVHFFRFKYPG